MSNCRRLTLVLLLAALLMRFGITETKASPAIRLTFDKTFYNRSETFSANVKATNDSSEALNYTKIALSIFPPLKAGETIETAFKKQAAPIITQQWFKSLSAGLTEINLTRDLAALGLSEGVYPAEVGLTMSNRQTFVDRSFLVILEPKDPLPVAILWNLHQPKNQLPDGTFINDSLARLVEDKPESQGLLREQLSILLNHPALRVNMAWSPTLTEQLSDMAKGYKWQSGKKTIEVKRDDEEARAASNLLDLVRQVQENGQAEILTSPYGQAPLPLFTSFAWSKYARAQLELAKTVSKKTLSLEHPPRGLYLPGLLIDKQTAIKASKSRFQYTIAQADSSNTTAGPQPPLNFKRDGRNLSIFTSDAEITKWLRTAYHEKAGQELVALLAHRYLFGSKSGVVTIAPDTAHWLPSPQLLQALYSTLNNTEWIKTTTLKSYKNKHGKPINFNTVKKGEIDKSYLAGIKRAYKAFRDFDLATSRANELRKRLERQFYVLQSIDYVGETDEGIPPVGKTYARDIWKTVDSELAKLDLTTPSNITFSTSVGKIPIAIINRTGYPIKAKLHLSGKDFSFSDDKRSVALMPKENLISYNITASFIGVSKLKATVFIGNRQVASRYIEVGVSSKLRYLVVSVMALLVVGSAGIVYFKRRYR